MSHVSGSLSRRSFLAATALGLVAPRAFAAPGDPLRVVGQVEISSLEPASGSGFIMLRMGIGETLVALDRNGQTAPGLAVAWENPDRGKAWRFRLRENALFHDGSPVTSDAVVASLTRAASTSQGLKLAGIGAIRADAPNLLTIETNEPNAVLPWLLTEAGTVILSPASYGPDGRVAKPVATGPYRFVSLEGRTELRTRAFAEYWGPKPAIAEAIYTGATNPETRSNIAAADDAEVVFNVPPASIQRLRAEGRDIQSVQLPRTLYVILNHELPMFADLRVRRALSMAIDRPALGFAALRDNSAGAEEVFAPSMRPWHLGIPASRPNIASAEALLDEAGWLRSADGIRVKQGQRLSFELFVFATRAELPIAATILQAAWKTIGVEANILAGEWTVVPERQKNGTLQAAMMSRGYSIAADPIPLIIADFGRDRSEWGAMNWKNDRFRELASSYSRSFDESARRTISQDLARIIADDLPVIPLLWTPLSVSVSKRVSGVTIDPFEMRFFIESIRWS